MPTLTRSQQKDLIRELSNAIRDYILDDIDKGKVPAEWDGIELRQLLADRSKDNAYAMNTTRRRAYNNTVLVNDL